jgi:hypothetical protein
MPWSEAAESGDYESMLAFAPIVATFRSAREAWSVADELSGTSPVWVRASFGGSWSFVIEEPPRRDRLPDPTVPLWPIGNRDAGWRGMPLVYALPSPLQQRGVIVAHANLKGNALLSFQPRDRSLTVFTSWREVEDRVGSGSVDFWGWAGTDRVPLDWSDRDRLKQ